MRVLPLPGQHRRERREGLARPRRRLEQRADRTGPHCRIGAVHDLELRPGAAPGARQVHRHALARQREHAARRLRVEVDDRRRQRREAAAHVRVPLWRSRRRPVLVVAAGAALGFFFAGAPLAVPASRLALTGARGRGGDSVAPVRSTTSSSYARSIANALLTCLLVLLLLFESSERTAGATRS